MASPNQPIDPKLNPVILPPSDLGNKPVEKKEIPLPPIEQEPIFRTNPDREALEMARRPQENLVHRVQLPHRGPEETPHPFVYQRSHFVPPPTPQQYRALSHDPVFQNPNLQNSGLHRYLQAKGTGQKSPDNLNRGIALLLFRVRTQVEDRKGLFQIAKEVFRHLKGEEESSPRTHRTSTHRHESGEDALLSFKGLEVAGENPFENVLQEFHGREEQGLMKNLPLGKDATFLGKSNEEWTHFFENIKKFGSIPQEVVHDLDTLMHVLVRGIHTDEKDLKKLVGDFFFKGNEDREVSKFARLLIDHPDILEKLQTLKPGDRLDKNFFDGKLSELVLTELLHIPEGQTINDGNIALLHQLRGLMNPDSTQKLEKALLEERKRREEEARQSQILPIPFPLPSDRLPRDSSLKPDRPRLWIFLIVTLLSIITALALYRFLS